MDFFELAHTSIKEIGGILGTTSTVFMRYVFNRFKSVEKKSIDAYELSEKLKSDIEEIKLNIRLELETIRKNIEEQSYERRMSASRPDFDEQQRRSEELNNRIDEIREDNLRDRNAHNILRKELSDFTKGEAEAWRELNRSLGQIEGRLEKYLASK